MPIKQNPEASAADEDLLENEHRRTVKDMLQAVGRTINIRDYIIKVFSDVCINFAELNPNLISTQLFGLKWL